MEMTLNNKNKKKYSSYKDSGVEWLGKIPIDWEVIKLKHLLKFSTGGTPSSQVNGLYDGDIPWVTISDMDGRIIKNSHFISKKGVKSANITQTPKGSLLYSFKLSVGQVAFTEENIYTNEAIASFHPIEKVNLNFWFYVLPIFLIKNANTNIYGAYLLNQDLIKNAIIIAPPLQEQTAIANFLDRKTALIDQAITIKKKQIELLKERRQIIIHNAVTKGFDNTVKLKDSGVQWIGQIPEHWKVETLKNILTERNEKNDPIRTKEILSLSIDKGVTLYAEKTTNLDRFKDDFSQYKLAHKGDLVFNSMNMIVGAVGVSEYFGCVSPVYYTYSGRHDNSNTKFYEYLFRCKTIQGVLYSLGKGLIAIDRGEGKYNTLRLKVSRDDLRSLRLPFPSYSEQNQIIVYIETQSSKIDTLISLKEQEIEKIKEYKATLIKSAVTGEIKV